MSIAEPRARTAPIALPVIAFLCVLVARLPVLLAHQDIAYALEFGDLKPASGVAIGLAYGGGCLLLAIAALVR